MKTTTFRLIATMTLSVLLSVPGMGQQVYETFLEDGKVWTYRHQSPIGSQYNVSLTVKGDTTINGTAYKKICDVGSGAFQYALREEGQRVYCKYQNVDTPQLLYDFGANAGDTFSTETASGETAMVQVLKVDTITVGSRQFRRMEVCRYESVGGAVATEPQDASLWVEGIGSLFGLDSPFSLPGGYQTFLSCQIGGETFLQSPLFVSTGLSSVRTSEYRGDGTIYTLGGLRLQAEPEKGVYIKDGRKWVKK